MATFMCFLNWTDQAAKTLKDAPKRQDALMGMVQKAGGKLVSAYVTTGQYDVVLILDMPNGEAMTQLSVAIAAMGNHRTTTARAFTPAEFNKIVAAA